MGLGNGMSTDMCVKLLVVKDEARTGKQGG